MSKDYLDQLIRNIVDDQLQGHLRVHHTSGNSLPTCIEREATIALCCDEVHTIFRQAKVDLILRGSV
jgi:hypothetical protein